MPEPLNRAAIESAPRELLSRGSRVKPAVWRVELPDAPIILKDTSGLGRLGRSVARLLLARELRVLRRLDGVAGVPAVVAEVDRDAFACSLLDGAPLTPERVRQAPDAFAKRLHALIETLHERGVYHLDLHQRQNILMTESSELRIVDFGAAVAPGALGRWVLGPFFAWIDRQAVLKFIARFAPDCLTEDEAREVLRVRRLRRLWVFGAASSQRESTAARERLREGAGRRESDASPRLPG